MKTLGEQKKKRRKTEEEKGCSTAVIWALLYQVSDPLLSNASIQYKFYLYFGD